VIRALSDAHESARPDPWSVEDAPPDYINRLTRGVVGVRLSITRVEGKAKLGQKPLPRRPRRRGPEPRRIARPPRPRGGGENGRVKFATSHPAAGASACDDGDRPGARLEAEAGVSAALHG
jgi:hypothetical protein